MTKNVVFYARYSTTRQNELTIETQIEQGQRMIAERGWNLVEVYKDSGISGTQLKTRPGIQALLNRIERKDIDIVLCVSVDRISRDVEHSASILKNLSYNNIELWTVTGNGPISDMELGIRAVLSHELIQDIRVKTREGMKKTISQGKAAGGLAYGYRIKLEYDVKGERIPGLREIESKEAEIVRWIFQEYANGKSPTALAVQLNAKNIPGPRGLKWRDTAIRGHRKRGSGILNNEQYNGRLLWNRTTFKKNPLTESRTSTNNNRSEWQLKEVPELQIIDDQLWAKVKQQQIKNERLFSRTTTNKLNKSHRPRYLLSGLLECAHCGGPYAIMGKGRYGCTNRQKKLPIDMLGGIVCTNSKTILRSELEDRILVAFPEGFFSTYSIERIQKEVTHLLQEEGKQGVKQRGQLTAKMQKIELQQRHLMEQLAVRAAEGRPPIAAFNDMIDTYETERNALKKELDNLPVSSSNVKLPTISPELIKANVDSLVHVLKNSTDPSKELWFNMAREMIQKVVINPSPDNTRAELTIHGRLATIMASMAAWEEHSKIYYHEAKEEYLILLAQGKFKCIKEKIAFGDRLDKRLAKEKHVWERLQVSVVAGAGFEPAAFRL